MQRSLPVTMMRMLHQQQNPSTMQKWMTTMNVITLISPTPVVSTQMIQGLQRWTQQPFVEVSGTIPTAGMMTPTSSTKQNRGCYYYTSDHETDALDAWALKKQKSSHSPWRQQLPFLHQRQNFPTSHSVVLCVGGDCTIPLSDSTTVSTASDDRTTTTTTHPTPTTFIHVVSPSSMQNNSMFPFNSERNINGNVMNLLSIQSFHVPMDIIGGQKETLIHEIRNRLAQLLDEKENEHRINVEHMKSSLSWADRMKVSMRQFIRRRQEHQKGANSTVFSSLREANDYIPFFDLTTSVPPSSLQNRTDHLVEATLPKWQVGDLKEIVIPFDFSNTAPGNSRATTFIDILSRTNQDKFHRPVTGLYQLPNSNVCIRPIPMGKQDRQSNISPTLIFQSSVEHMDEILKRNDTTKTQDRTTKFMKIGYTGRQSDGQIMISDGSQYGGMHVRLCSQQKPSSRFAEAQDSLFASSLSELQSQDVLLAKEETSADPRTNNTDCWVEFRANLRHPLGFLPLSSLLSTASSSPPKIAKAPNLPYE